ncbi:hypothetical protein niasHT_031950 [Heterodera trifolii]|uniref:Uncharacterized protein n=1 Tax=Heterodera trifolii TaxID=157864 RepID=A0ABD2HX82_9BILA
MFCQECVRAYPLAASAWSMLAVAITDKMFRHTKMPRCKLSGVGGDWSKKSSLALTAGGGDQCTTIASLTPLDMAVHSLSHNLQQRALASLHGFPTFAGGSAASSFRCRKFAETSARRHALSGAGGATQLQCKSQQQRQEHNAKVSAT